MLCLTYFVVCGVSRLARFNVTAADLADSATGKVKYFEGTPIPTSILIVALLAVALASGRIDEPALAGRLSDRARVAASAGADLRRQRQRDDQRDAEDPEALIGDFPAVAPRAPTAYAQRFPANVSPDRRRQSCPIAPQRFDSCSDSWPRRSRSAALVGPVGAAGLAAPVVDDRELKPGMMQAYIDFQKSDASRRCRRADRCGANRGAPPSSAIPTKSPTSPRSTASSIRFALAPPQGARRGRLHGLSREGLHRWSPPSALTLSAPDPTWATWRIRRPVRRWPS